VERLAGSIAAEALAAPNTNPVVVNGV